MNYAEEERRYEQEMLMAAKIGPSFGYRRLPRTRLVVGRKGLFESVASSTSKKKAFRIARNRRDSEGESRPPRNSGRLESGMWATGGPNEVQ